jgi:hypothetical protein
MTMRIESFAMNHPNCRQVLDCGGRAQRRRRFGRAGKSGVALRLPPHDATATEQAFFGSWPVGGSEGNMKLPSSL